MHDLVGPRCLRVSNVCIGGGKQRGQESEGKQGIKSP